MANTKKTKELCSYNDLLPLTTTSAAYTFCWPVPQNEQIMDDGVRGEMGSDEGRDKRRVVPGCVNNTSEF